MMTKRDGASARESATAAWARRYQAAYEDAAREIARLRPSEAILYHEGNLAVDGGNDPAVAGRAAAFRDAAEAHRGITAQRRLGFERYRYIFWRSRHDHR